MKNAVLAPFYSDHYSGPIAFEAASHKLRTKLTTGRDHCPTLSISDDLPEAGGGGASVAPEVAASDDDDGGDDDGEPARRRFISKSTPLHSPALLSCDPLQHYIGFGRSRIYALISQGEFPPPIKIGKSSRWVKAEVDAWLSRQIAARNSNQIAG